MAIILDEEVSFLRDHTRFKTAILETQYGEWSYNHNPTPYHSRKFTERTLLINRNWLENNARDLMTWPNFGEISYIEIVDLCKDHGILIPEWPRRPRLNRHVHELIVIFKENPSTQPKILASDLLFKCEECGIQYKPAGWKKVYE